MEKVYGKLPNEENTWDNVTTCEEPCGLIKRDKILKVLRMMKKGKTAGPTDVISNWITYPTG